MKVISVIFRVKLILLVVVVPALMGIATAQNVLAMVPISAASAGQIGVNSALNRVYAGGGPNSGGSTLTVIDGVTFNVIGTYSGDEGVTVDMKQDNYWVGTGSAGSVEIFAGPSNTEIGNVALSACPAAITYDCARRSMWVGSQCGSGTDPVFSIDANTFKLNHAAISTGGTISFAPVVNPDTGKLYVTSGGVSKEVDPKTFAVSNTPFNATVLAIDSFANHLFAISKNAVLVVNGKTEAVSKTINLAYTPAGIGANNAIGHAYFTNSGGNSVDVYTETGKKVTTLSLGAGNQPTSIAVDSARSRLYVDVLNGSSWSLWVIEDLSNARHCTAAGSCDY